MSLVRASIVAAAIETSSVPPAAAGSSSMSMQAMSSSVHFGLGDPFFASFLTPVNSTGYVALLFLLMMLSFRVNIQVEIPWPKSAKIASEPGRG